MRFSKIAGKKLKRGRIIPQDEGDFNMAAEVSELNPPKRSLEAAQIWKKDRVLEAHDDEALLSKGASYPEKVAQSFGINRREVSVFAVHQQNSSIDCNDKPWKDQEIGHCSKLTT